MLQTLEAIITQSGLVKFNEPFTLEHSVKAYVTILPDAPADSIKPPLGKNLLQVLESAPFNQASFGDSDKLAQQIQDNRNAWND